MKLNDVFDHIYLINLDTRLDRWMESKEEFAKYGIEAERFPASTPADVKANIYVKPGEAGLIHTHQRIFQDALANDYESILILEDDVEFDPNFENELHQIPEDWENIFIGGNYTAGMGKHVSGSIYKANQTLACHAIGFKKSQYQNMLDAINYFVPIDVTYAGIQHLMISYVFKPVLAWQRASWSDLMNGYMDYKFLRNE